MSESKRGPSSADADGPVRSFLRSFVSDFEGDFVLDGRIVDNPRALWGPLVPLYEGARRALAAMNDADDPAAEDSRTLRTAQFWAAKNGKSVLLGGDAVGLAVSWLELRAALLSARESAARGPAFDLVAHLAHQREWSATTFGPAGCRTPEDPTAGVRDHLARELAEVSGDPGDLEEWIDVVILAFDGAWRAGHEPEEIVSALIAKQAKNEARSWPDWRTVELGGRSNTSDHPPVRNRKIRGATSERQLPAQDP